jgi:hypothetical protein
MPPPTPREGSPRREISTRRLMVPPSGVLRGACKSTAPCRHPCTHVHSHTHAHKRTHSFTLTRIYIHT